ncbi:MAG TPA: hypothetical protein DF480_01670, partial [Clostridiales bacterium]|nr:hypothetical protein [Clostridiales bacterium]
NQMNKCNDEITSCSGDTESQRLVEADSDEQVRSHFRAGRLNPLSKAVRRHGCPVTMAKDLTESLERLHRMQ